MQARRLIAVGVVAAALALASIGATGVSAREENNDDRGAAVTAPVAQQPFTYGYRDTALAPTAPFANASAFADFYTDDK